MSFVKKAVKKVFKFAKRLVKKTVSFTKRLLKNKYFQIALVIAASVFTAGIAAGGFQLMNGALGSVGSFFSAVGNTISAGFSAIGSVVTGGATFAEAFPAAASALGAAPAAVAGTTANTTGVLAAGAGAPLTGAAAGGAAGGASAAATAGYGTAITESALAAAGQGTAAVSGISGVTATGAGLTAAEAANTGWTVANAGTGVGSAAPEGFLSKIGTLMMDPGIGGSMMRGGVMMGIQGYYKQKELEKQEYYYRNRTVWGNAAFGSEGKSLGMLSPSWSKSFTGATSGGGLLTAPKTETPNVYQQPPAGSDQFAQQPADQAAGPGVPGQMTQPPPATQPQQNLPTPGAQLENMGVGG